MEKFMSVPVLDADGTNSQNMLISIVGIERMFQFNATELRISYSDGKEVRLVYPVTDTTFTGDAGAYLEEVQNFVAEALNSGWTRVVHQYNPSGFIAGTPVAGEPGSAANTNPLSSVTII
tara:strand:+ start:148 stop:507 length:360 start_codon:yes stop_codon:yes gene_type:complete